MLDVKIVLKKIRLQALRVDKSIFHVAVERSCDFRLEFSGNLHKFLPSLDAFYVHVLDVFVEGYMDSNFAKKKGQINQTVH